MKTKWPRINLQSRGWGWIAAILVGLFAYTIRIYQLGASELSFDEIATNFVIHRPFWEIIPYIMNAAREHPPLYFLAMNLWTTAAGNSEFAIRYFSVLAGLLTIPLSYRLGRQMLGRAAGIWTALLMTVAPLGLALAQFGRMYTLVLLISLLTLEAWWRWLHRPTRRNQIIFTLLAFLGPLVHYYLGLLWAAEAALMLLAPRATRAIRRPWLITVGLSAAALGGFILLSPGIYAMMQETGSRFPYYGSLRLEEFRILLLDLYLNWHYPTLLPPALIALGLTVGGWIVAQRRQAPAGLLLALWALIPVALSYFVPETMAPRYFTPILPALILGLAAAVAACRPQLLRLGLGLLVLGEAVYHWDHVYLAPTRRFSEQVTFLNATACPGDGILMNGPWPYLFFSYYQLTEELPILLVPSVAPPGFNPEEDLPRLENFAAQHHNLWTFYGAVEPADPHYQASRWLAENSYQTYRYHDLVLYQTGPAPVNKLTPDIAFGNLQLQKAYIDHAAAAVGGSFYLDFYWGGRPLDREDLFSLALIDSQGRPWGEIESRFGPAYLEENVTLPTPWIERRAYRVQPGIPPGQYTLGLKINSPKAAAPSKTVGDGWFPLLTVTITSADPPATACPQSQTPYMPASAALNLTFTASDAASQVKLLGLAPATTKFTHGYPLKMDLWWQAGEKVAGAQVQARLVGRGTSAGAVIPLGPDFYPTAAWAPGIVVSQKLEWMLPDDLPGGEYHIQIQVTDAAGLPWTASGTRQGLSLLEQLARRPVSMQGEWADVAVVQIEERARAYAPPLFITSRDVQLGDMLRLRGYQLSAARAHPGESLQLTVYWQALRRTDRTYAVFNHLRRRRDNDQELVWQQDSWPQAGIYTTQHWLPGEVVAESYTITIPEDAAPGTLILNTGVYDQQTGERLPAVPASGQRYINDIIPLLTLEVVP